MSCSVMSNSLQPHELYSPWNSPGQNTGVGSHCLLQGIVPTQGSNPGLPHCRQILYQLSHQGSPRTLEWVAYPFSRGIFLTQESNWGLLYGRWILYQQSYRGSYLAAENVTGLLMEAEENNLVIIHLVSLHSWTSKPEACCQGSYPRSQTRCEGFTWY